VIKSSVKMMGVGIANTIGFDVANMQKAIDPTIAEYGVIAGIIIGGGGLLANIFEKISNGILKWKQHNRDNKKDK